MNKRFVLRIIVQVACLMLLFFAANAQNDKSAVSQKGFWVVVTNMHVKKEATIQFYNDDKKLIYEEKITGKKLKLNKRKTIRCLEEGLDKALNAFNNDRAVLKDKGWMATLLASR